MSRTDDEVLDDIASAIGSIRSRLRHGPVTVEIVFDAVAMRLVQIGESVKALSAEMTRTEPGIAWRDIAGMRDFLAHHYFTASPDIVEAVVEKDLQPLADAVARMRSRLPNGPESTGD